MAARGKNYNINPRSACPTFGSCTVPQNTNFLFHQIVCENYLLKKLHNP